MAIRRDLTHLFGSVPSHKKTKRKRKLPSSFLEYLFIPGDMGFLRLRVPAGLCLLLLMPLLLLPCSRGSARREFIIKDSSGSGCEDGICYKTCYNLGFSGGDCLVVSMDPFRERCVCRAPRPSLGGV